MLGVALGLLAAALQIAGYVFYIRGFLTKAIRPNAASYIMFAYGTALVAFLAWENGATSRELALPLACAGMSIFVAGLCLRNNMTERIDNFERGVFLTDLALTVAYATLALNFGHLGGLALMFLFLGNVTTLTSFLPILRSTWKSPGREQPLPWAVWTAAYLTLTAATLVETGLANPILLLYPVLNAGLHLGMTLLAMRTRNGRRDFRDGGRAVYHDDSPIAGLGVFAGRRYRQGDVIWTLAGPVHTSSVPDENPDFVGLGPGLWIDPARPLDKLNHSCAPNAAFGRKRDLIALRDIGECEEITFDYSTTEVDPGWRMPCSCGTPSCRVELRAIQISFAESATPPAASPLMQAVWRNRSVPDGPAFPQLMPAAKRKPKSRRTPAAKLAPAWKTSAKKNALEATG